MKLLALLVLWFRTMASSGVSLKRIWEIGNCHRLSTFCWVADSSILWGKLSVPELCPVV
jgi:hypothetical protein